MKIRNGFVTNSSSSCCGLQKRYLNIIFCLESFFGSVTTSHNALKSLSFILSPSSSFSSRITASSVVSSQCKYPQVHAHDPTKSGQPGPLCDTKKLLISPTSLTPTTIPTTAAAREIQYSFPSSPEPVPGGYRKSSCYAHRIPGIRSSRSSPGRSPG